MTLLPYQFSRLARSTAPAPLLETLLQQTLYQHSAVNPIVPRFSCTIVYTTPMATDADFIHYIEFQLTHIPGITTRKMFGEYALYCNSKVVAFICDNTFFLKINPATAAVIHPETEQGPCYPGSKDYYIIEESKLESKDYMKKLIEGCADYVAMHEKKKSKKK